MNNERARQAPEKGGSSRSLLAIAALAVAVAGIGGVTFIRSEAQSAAVREKVMKTPDGPTKKTLTYSLTRLRGDYYKAGPGDELSLNSSQLIMDLSDKGCTFTTESLPGDNAAYLRITACNPLE